MSSTAPPTRPSTATMTNGTRYQVGRIVASAPIGSVLIALDSDGGRPGEQQPEPEQEDRRDRRAERRPPHHAGARRAPRQVARVVGAGVHPAEAEPGRHQHGRAEERLGGARVQPRDRGPVDLVARRG